jgi:hypothetical protein
MTYPGAKKKKKREVLRISYKSLRRARISKPDDQTPSSAEKGWKYN